MPRASSTKQRQPGANGSNSANSQAGGHIPAGHSHRHVGANHAPVGLGRRVAKSRSPNQLNGNAAIAPVDTTTERATPPLSDLCALSAMYSNPAYTHGFVTTPSATAAATAVVFTAAAPGHDPTTQGFPASRGNNYSESALPESFTMSLPTSSAGYVPPPMLANGIGHRQINVNDAKNHNVHRDTGSAKMALNVLRSCPLQDTMAILIILMNVAPWALTCLSVLFTLLTFVVPPVTTSSGLRIADMFDINQDTPSLTTLLCMDIIVLGIWLFLWAPMQECILDLSQVVIALTLGGGGGGSSRHGMARNIVLCVAVVGASQWARQLNVLRLSQLAPFLGRTGRLFSTDADDPMATPTVHPSLEKHGRYGWLRSVFYIHIVTQGLVRYIREWYLRREKRDLLSQTQLDPEAGKATLLSSAESATDGSVALTHDSSEPGAQVAQTTMTTKKRRKQSALVRIRQPLWAALASTKIVMVKEYELSHAVNESAGSNATDIHNLGNATFNTQPEQIWICFIGAGEVCFNTSFFSNTPQSKAACSSTSSSRGGGVVVDRSKPFYVRVNKAIWQPVRIVPIEGGEEEASLDGIQWTGDISGLTPLSNYECEFVRTTTDEVIFSIHLQTMAAKTTDQDAASGRPSGGPPSRPHRPDSPATTLRASIKVAETELTCKKTQLRTVRKENHRKIASIRKEIEKLTTSTQSAGGNDDKLRQKAAQNRNLTSQAEEACRALEKQLKEVESIPQDVQRRHSHLRRQWTEAKARFDAARGALNAFKAHIDHEVKVLEDDVISLEAKRDKIATRIAKADEDRQRIANANRQGLNEAHRRLHKRADFENEMRRIETQYRAKIDMLQSVHDQKQSQMMLMTQQLQAYLASFQQEGSAAAAATAAAGAGDAGAVTPSWGSTMLASTSHGGSAVTSVPGQQQQPPMWPASSSMAAVSQSLTCSSSFASMAHVHPASTPSLSMTSATPAQAVRTNRTTAGKVARTPPHALHVGGRSLLTLGNNVSGFTQPPAGEDDNRTGGGHNHGHPISPPPGLGYGHVFHASHHGPAAHVHPFGPVGSPYGAIRPPPGLGFSPSLHRDLHGRAQSEGSSMESGSGRGHTPASGESEEGEGFASGPSSVRSGSGSRSGGGQSPV